MAFSFIASIVMAFVLSLVSVGSRNAIDGIQIAFWMWLGFVATTSINEYLFLPQPKPWALYYLNNGYQLASLIIMSIILSLWK